MNDHAVYIYEDDRFLVHNVAQFVMRGLEQGDTVIAVATGKHRDDLRAELMAHQAIGLSADGDGRYVTLDAADTLSLFMVNGWPDERLFLKAIGDIVRKAARGRRIRIYGEMVAVLWAEGRREAALRLEQLWNTLAEQCTFFLLCGYPASAFQDEEEAPALQKIYACHSHRLGAHRA